MNDEYTPRIVGFLCNWCSYTGADLAGVSRLKVPPSLRIIRVMCSGRIDPLFVLKAFLKGIDGVMMMGCHPGECHYQKGNYNARRRFILLQKILEAFDLEPERLGIWWVSASEATKYAKVTTEFAKEIEKIGPSPVANEIFL
ncbi:MAG: hydrogenase iron-sulfur subunit [Ignavibacteria bacterium]|nr:hydrogenase iron-sulfur subunit [Ignavibacteria bacterium]